MYMYMYVIRLLFIIMLFNVLAIMLQTLVVMPIRVAGQLPDNFPEPEKFKPERWSRKNKDTVNVFGSLPFGFGVRMCVGELCVILLQHEKLFNTVYTAEEQVHHL